jgi:hypothetical protein
LFGHKPNQKSWFNLKTAKKTKPMPTKYIKHLKTQKVKFLNKMDQTHKKDEEHQEHEEHLNPTQ